MEDRASLRLARESEAPSPTVEPRRRIEFGSFAELKRLPAVTPSLWEGFLPLGSLSMLWGDAKSGKSTLIAGLLRALKAGEPFLGQPTSPATAVWVSEEPDSALREKAKRFGLLDLKGSLAGAERVFGFDWTETISQASEHALSKGHKLLIVDTFTGLANLGPEEENDAGAIAKRLRPLRVASSHGLAVVFVHHTNKHGLPTPRGSGAFSAGVDTSIQFRRHGQSRRFSLASTGRYATSVDLEAVLVNDGATWSYRLLEAKNGRSTEKSSVEVDGVLWRSLPVDQATALTFAELAEHSGLSIDRVEYRLRKWCKQKRSGLGRAGGGNSKVNPFRWYREPQ